MKSSCGKDQIDVKQKNAFFSESESIAKQTDRSGAILEPRREQCSVQQTSVSVADRLADKKNAELFLSRRSTQPHPFTFITAVKRKLAVAAYNDTSKKLYSNDANRSLNLNIEKSKIDANSKESLYSKVQKMDFIKPLKIPDVKISPKNSDCTTKDNSNIRDTTTKYSLPTTSQKNDKISKTTERAHRKLDFSLSEGFLSCDDIEPLITPDVCISPSIAKKKEHARDNSREKENRGKRMKRDDSSVTRNDDIAQESSKRGARNLKHISRKDVAESKRSRNDRSSKDAEFLSSSNNQKMKNFSTSTTRKDDDKRTRSTSIHSTKGWRDKSLESRGRTASSESLVERNFKGHDKSIGRETSRITDSDVSITKYNDDYQILNALRQLEEQKHKSSMDNNKSSKITTRSLSQSNQQRTIDTTSKEQIQQKRIIDRTKSLSKIQGRTGSTTSEIHEDIETVSDSNSSKNRCIYGEASSTQQTKNKIIDSIVSQQSPNVESQNTSETSSEIILDPSKISFRDDSYSQQEEFCNLVTPDMNLNVRSKRRKQLADTDSSLEIKTLKQKNSRAPDTTTNVGVPMLHPTALHMQFQAELHLFDSYNESLRQVMDVENCLHNAKHEKGKEILFKQRQANEEMKKQLIAMQTEKDNGECAASGATWSIHDDKIFEDFNDNEANKSSKLHDVTTELLQSETKKLNNRQKNDTKDSRGDVKVAEVQTQTANDIATQTDTRIARYTVAERLKQYPGITYDRGCLKNNEIPELSLGSFEQFQDLDNIEDISLPSKMRTMSEISLHETTSSIKTETGTEISISTRDVTCSFNKYLDLEMAQLIKDEKLMYDKIEMLFKSREKTLNDRTRKLVKLEEQKRALRDTGQDSRISSVKKKQRALLLKLQQEKDEMNRLKELHKMASQERKLMLQKQRNMFNPQMSTKNILTKLKRSADCQSPRRLSGPMKGYDIRSNSSMSSLVDSDKSQLDRSQMDIKLQQQQSDSSQRLDGKSLRSDIEISAPEKIEANKNRKYMSVLEESKSSLNDIDFITNFDNSQKIETKSRKFEDKMPCSMKTNYPIRPKHATPTISHNKILDINQGLKTNLLNADNSENPKSESDTLVEELSKKSKSHITVDNNNQVSPLTKENESINNDIITENDSVNSRKSKASQVTEESLLGTNCKISKKSDKSLPNDREISKKSQHHHESKSTNKRKGSKSLKAKPTSNILTENILRSKGNNHDDIRSTTKRTKNDKDSLPTDDHYQSSILEELDLNESQNSLHALVKHSRAVKDKNYKLLRDIASEHETKENILTRNIMERGTENREYNSRRDDNDIHNLGNISTRSQVSTFTISRHSSGDSEKSFSRSVVIRAQDHRFKTSKKLEQVLNAREAALTTRRNCVEDWIAWHTKLKAEENRVARMEQAAFKLVSTANVLPYNDTTMSSDTSDVEGRVELLAEKLAERRAEMSKLKREARRQAKQRLKALEANLLNQIKKYDTTIHEMRKKLESQKTGLKESEKLAIESRSVADFKVPEIPLKRIQEIYKSSDLLRSRSESDLIFSKCSHDENNRNAYSSDTQDKSKDIVYKSMNSMEKKNSRLSTFSNERDEKTSQSVESVLDEAKSSDYSEKRSEVSSERKLQTPIDSQSEENIVTDKSERFPTESIAEQIVKTRTSDSHLSGEISEILPISGSDASSKLFSRKLESLQLTNKNLNDDISTLENDLKALSEMMSHFSKKSDDKLKTVSSPITDIENIVETTEMDISEELTKSEELKNSENSEKVNIQKSIDSITEQSKISEINKISENLQLDCSEKYESEVVSTIIPDVENSVKNSTEEIDFEARSKEILNVIEKSIISERVKSPITELDIDSSIIDKSMKNINQDNEELSNNINSLEGDIKSISQIISKISEGKRNIELAKDFSDTALTIEESLVPREETFDMPVLQLDNENSHSKIIENEPNENETEKSLSKIIQSDKILVEKNLNDHSSIDESAKLSEFNKDEPETISEDISDSKQEEDELYNENSLVSKKSSINTEDRDDISNNRSNESSLESSINDNDELKETEGISIGRISLENDWTVSNSFQVAEKIDESVNSEWEKSVQPEITIDAEHFIDKGNDDNLTVDICDVSAFIPRGESTAIGYKFDDTTINVAKSDSMQTDELDDILDIIERESKQTENSCRENYLEIPIIDSSINDINEFDKISIDTQERIIPRPTDLNLTAEVEPVLQKLTEILQGVERNIARRRKSGSDIETNCDIVQSPNTPEIKDSKVSTEPISESIVISKELNIEQEKTENLPLSSENDEKVTENFESIDEEKNTQKIEDLSKSEKQDKQETSLSSSDIVDKKIVDIDSKDEWKNSRETIPKLVEKTFEILRDPEYEDISEESLEVSEILDRSESQKSSNIQKIGKIPDKYEVKQKSDDVLRILDEISQQSYAGSTNKSSQHLNNLQISVQVFGSVSPGLTSQKSNDENNEAQGKSAETIETLEDHMKSVEIEITSLNDKLSHELLPKLDETRDKLLENSKDTQDEICRKQEQDLLSESSEGADTPRGVSEIEMDSPRDPNESRLDIDALDDDLLSANGAVITDGEVKVDFNVTPVIATSEKDIEAMIDKLKASLEQPGLEVAELEAKLLRIEQLQIELEIKKLEAEEVSFYVREIPNKPPPPYTPPGGSRLSTPQVSPTLPPAVVPSNVEELTAFTEKATVLIFNAKNSGEDITNLQAPLEICELSKDNNEISKQDRRIYNTFLFDLCKETIAELYRSEYEKPGPSWTKPNVKTKPAMKIPKTIEQLNDYVSKEVATLFGFKTKLQRENMVMRWSRKRRDRVDELLAREAQAEEDEWTKFHHDELAVKNELTVAILDTLILETTNVVKAVYAKKRRVMA